MERLAQIGRYQLLGEVARGGMGVVYRAQGPDGQPVALKLLLAGRTYSNRADVRVQLGQPQAAIADCDQAIALDPRNGTAYFNRGRARAQLGQFEAALADHERSLKLTPEDRQRAEILREITRLESLQGEGR